MTTTATRVKQQTRQSTFIINLPRFTCMAAASNGPLIEGNSISPRQAAKSSPFEGHQNVTINQRRAKTPKPWRIHLMIPRSRATELHIELRVPWCTNLHVLILIAALEHWLELYEILYQSRVEHNIGSVRLNLECILWIHMMKAYIVHRTS